MNTRATLPRTTMNRTEAAWARELEALRRADLVQWYAYEPTSIRLGNGAHYTPDFLVLTAEGQVEAHEIKGRKGNGAYYREAARVRIKVAATRVPWMRFKQIRPGGKGEPRWVVEEVKAHG